MMHACMPSMLQVIPVSGLLFETWACVQFELDHKSRASQQYLRSDLSMRCSTSDFTNDQHEQLKVMSWVFIAIWPIGVVLLYAGLVVACRRAITSGTSSGLSRATSFLHREYRPDW